MNTSYTKGENTRGFEKSNVQGLKKDDIVVCVTDRYINVGGVVERSDKKASIPLGSVWKVGDAFGESSDLCGLGGNDLRTQKPLRFNYALRRAAWSEHPSIDKEDIMIGDVMITCRSFQSAEIHENQIFIVRKLEGPNAYCVTGDLLRADGSVDRTKSISAGNLRFLYREPDAVKGSSQTVGQQTQQPHGNEDVFGTDQNRGDGRTIRIGRPGCTIVAAQRQVGNTARIDLGRTQGRIAQKR